MSAHIFFWLICLFGLAVICGISSLLISFRAVSHLSKHGTKIDYWDVRFHPLKYFKQYRELTIEEQGKPGSLFPAWIATISLFAVLMISLVVIVLIRVIK
jgi:hypothetical protein